MSQNWKRIQCYSLSREITLLQGGNYRHGNRHLRAVEGEIFHVESERSLLAYVEEGWWVYEDFDSGNPLPPHPSETFRRVEIPLSKRLPATTVAPSIDPPAHGTLPVWSRQQLTGLCFVGGLIGGMLVVLLLILAASGF